jgi:DNA-directed RNA polymerase subunit beta'
LMNLDSLELNKGSKSKEFTAQENGEIFVYEPKNEVECLVAEAVAEQCIKGTRVTSELIQSDVLKAGGLVISIKKSDRKKSSESHIVKVYPGQSYPYIKGAVVLVNDGDKVVINDILYRERLQDGDASKTQDIVQGLPRVEELFEARKPKEAAVLAEVDGVIDVIHHDHYSVVSITPEEGKRKEYKLSKDTRLGVYAGKNVKRGDQISDGRINPHDISITKGIVPTQEYLAEEVQRVYRSQGVSINSKHIDVIIRQMTRKITVTDMGDSTLLLNEMVDLKAFNKINEKLVAEGSEPAKGDRLLLGITRASLSTDSFISASSFQQTASVLTKAALEGQSDPMTGLKENVIIGKLIPAGTGLKLYKHISIKSQNSEHEEKVESLVAETV